MADDRASLADLKAAQAQLEELTPLLDAGPGGAMDMTTGQAQRVAAWIGREIARRERRKVPND